MKYSAGLVIIFILTITTSCSLESVRPTKNASRNFKDSIAKGSPDFQQGWKDGCETGMSAATNTFYQIFYTNNKIDGWKITSSPDYKTAWNTALWFCIHSDYVDAKSSIYGSFFKGYQ